MLFVSSTSALEIAFQITAHLRKKKHEEAHAPHETPLQRRARSVLEKLFHSTSCHGRRTQTQIHLPMVTPTLRRDQPHHVLRFPLPPPAPMAFVSAHPQQWRRPPMMENRVRADSISRFRNVTDLDKPVLPRIASLLKRGNYNLELGSLQSQDERETRKKKLHTVEIKEDPRGIPPMYHEPRSSTAPIAAATKSPPVVMFMRQREDAKGAGEIRVRHPAPVTLELDHRTPPSSARAMPNNANMPVVSSAIRNAVFREFEPRRVSAAAVRTVPMSQASSLPSSDSRSLVRPTPSEISSRCIHRAQTQRDPPTGLDTAQRRRLYYRHEMDKRKIHEIYIPPEIPVASHYHEGHSDLSRKHLRMARYYRQVSSLRTHSTYYDRNEEEEIEVSMQKRRRVAPYPTPTPPRQPLYEPEYGLTVLETSKSLVRTRYPSSMESAAEGDVPASRRRYIRGDSNGFEKVNSPLTVGSRINYNNAGEASYRTTDTSTPPVPRTQPIVKKCESSPLTTLVHQSKKFLKSSNLVRNRHDEIDWVATFLKVGFDSSSIYALVCPLRKGRWKSEEEKYTMGLLRLIENGTILLRHGQSIRGYIGDKLHSDDMRVFKKLSNCKMFHFAKLINPRLAQEEKLDTSVEGARDELEQLDQLKGEFLRSVQLEALVAVRKYLSDSSLRDLLNVRT